MSIAFYITTHGIRAVTFEIETISKKKKFIINRVNIYIYLYGRYTFSEACFILETKKKKHLTIFDLRVNLFYIRRTKLTLRKYQKCRFIEANCELLCIDANNKCEIINNPM